MNLPNKITLIRIALVPIFVFFYLASFIPYGKLVAALVFAAACFTDFLDGYIARKRNLVTNLGKFLDTIADKIVVMSGIILLVSVPILANSAAATNQPAIYPQILGAVAAIVILAREFLVSALRQIAATKGVVLAADMYGKVKAVFQFITLIFYFVYAFLVEEFAFAIAGTANTVLNILGYVLLGVTIILTIVSGVKYVTGNLKVFKDESKRNEKTDKVNKK